MLVILGRLGLERLEGKREGEGEWRRFYLWVRHAGHAGPIVRVEPHLDPLLARRRHVALHHARPLITTLL